MNLLPAGYVLLRRNEIKIMMCEDCCRAQWYLVMMDEGARRFRQETAKG